MKHLIPAVCVVAVAVATATFSWSEPGGNTPRLVGISIAQPDPDSKFGQSMVFGQNGGTKLTFRATKPGALFLGMDDDASKLASFTDDKGTDLSQERWLWTFPNISDDKKTCSFELHSEKAPAPGARELRIDATVYLKIGSDPQSADAKDVALVAGTSVKTGPVPFTVEKVGGKAEYGDSVMTVDLKSDQALDAITSMEFLAADGHVIETSTLSQMGYSINGKGDYTRTVGLKEKASKVTLRLKWFAKVESTPFRVSSAFGVGF